MWLGRRACGETSQDCCCLGRNATSGTPGLHCPCAAAFNGDNPQMTACLLDYLAAKTVLETDVCPIAKDSHAKDSHAPTA
jgi:hypothetical protein